MASSRFVCHVGNLVITDEMKSLGNAEEWEFCEAFELQKSEMAALECNRQRMKDQYRATDREINERIEKARLEQGESTGNALN